MAVLQYDLSVTGTQAVDAAFAHVEARARRANRLIAREGAKAGSGPRVRRAAAATVAGEAVGAAPVPRWWARQAVPMAPVAAGRWGRGSPTGAAHGPADRLRGGPGATAMAGAAARATGRQAAAAADSVPLPGQRPLTRADSAREQAMEARHAERVARIRERSGARVAKLEEAAAKKSGREREAAEKRAAQAAERSRQRLERITSQSQLRQQQRAEAAARRLELDKDRHAKRRAEYEARAQLAAARHARIAAARSGAAVRGAAGRAAVGSVATLGRGVMTTVGMGGTALVGASIYKQIAAEKSAADLANKAFNIPGETRSRDQIHASLVDQSTKIGKRTGNRAGVIESIDKFVAISGSLKGGQHLAQFMADISDATGASMSDVGRTGGQVLQNIVATKGRDLADPEQFAQSMRDVESILLAMAGQAKIGSIEFSDLAQQMGKVMSSTSRFTGDVGDLANQMGAISQLAIAGGASSPEEAMTAIMRFSDDLIENSHRFDAIAAQAGIKSSFFTDTGKTKLRDPTEVMMDVLRATKGDLTKVKKIFGIRAMKALEPFQQAYVTARQGGASEDAAIEQVQRTIDRFKSAKIGKGELGESAAFARSQAGRQLQIAWEDLSTTMGTELIPVFKELVPSIRDAMLALRGLSPAISWVAKFLANNPFVGIGAIVAAKITADIGMAALGEVLTNAVTARLGAGAAGTAAGAAGGAGAGKAGAAGAAGAFGLPLAAAIGGLFAAGTEAWSLAGNIRGGENQTGATDLTAGRAIDFLTGGYVSAAATLAGGGTAEEARKETLAGWFSDQLADMFAAPAEEPRRLPAELSGGGTGPAAVPEAIQQVATATTDAANTQDAAARQQADAARAQAEAATKMASAADVIAKAAPGLNRGNTPSPVPPVK